MRLVPRLFPSSSEVPGGVAAAIRCTFTALRVRDGNPLSMQLRVLVVSFVNP